MALRPTGEGALAPDPTTTVSLTVATNTVMARIRHVSGGGCHYNAYSAPAAAGAAGDFPIDVGDEIEVWGHPSMVGFGMIGRTDESAAVIRVQYYGDGS